VGGQVVTVVSCHMDSVFRDLENHSKVLAEGQVKVSLDAAIDFVFFLNRWAGLDL
jgi:hypothetical protein